MALVRCPIHKIPYNDENPRGCPACAREREGGEEASVMRELARVWQPGQRPGDPRGSRPPPTAERAAGTAPAEPVTEPPHKPAAPEAPRSLWERLRRNRRYVVGVGVTALLIVLLIMTSGPRFVAQPHPMLITQGVRPLAIEPGAPLDVVFAVLGSQAPRAVPEAPRLARYAYGSDLIVDAINAQVYAITFSVPNRSWHGLRPGLPERTAQGALALLGTPQESVPAAVPEPTRIDGYLTYPSLEARPRRTLETAVRPPNGCYDVEVRLEPRAIGVLRDGDRRLAVVGRGDAPLVWAVTTVRIVNRAIPGPYAEGTAC